MSSAFYGDALTAPLRARYTVIYWLTVAPVHTSLRHNFTHAEIASHLDRLLASAAFRPSLRSQEFLRFVVTRVMEGDEASIKERNIAIEVFARSLHYNSSEDSFVRVKASEVRRRLAAYYASPSPDDILRIELPLGGYVPQFVSIEPPHPEVLLPAPSVPPPRASFRWPVVSVAVVLFAVLAASLAYSFRPASPMDDFWSPILKSPEPVVIFLPLPPSYTSVQEAEAKRRADPYWETPGPAADHRFFLFTPHKVGVGAAIGAIRFATLCSRTGKPYTLKAGEDFSFADLRNQPSVLFGAFSSPWTIEINNEFRFKLIGGPGSHILDSLNPSRQWRATPGRYSGTPSEDYALACRVIDSKSGRTVIIAAGISTFGTQAAAEFLTEPLRLAELAGRAPHALSKGNFQVLLHTKVIGNTPTPARIIDAHFW